MTAPRERRTSPLEGLAGLAVGTWRISSADPSPLQGRLEAALELGIRLVDTADVYGLLGGLEFGAAERILGQVLGRSSALRAELIIATKGGVRPPNPYDSSPSYIARACEESLRRLQVDVIDLYQVHRFDHQTHPAELAGALTGLVEQGKCRAIGVSNYSLSQIEALERYLEIPLAALQFEFSLAHRAPLSDGTLDYCLRTGATPLAWSPLGGGRLVDPASNEDTDASKSRLDQQLTDIAMKTGMSTAAVAAAFVISHPGKPIAIVGTEQVNRLRDLADAMSAPLERKDWYSLLDAAGEDLP